MTRKQYYLSYPQGFFSLQEIWVEHWKLAAIIPIPSMLALWAGWREGKRFNTKVPDGAGSKPFFGIGTWMLRWPFKDCDFLSVCRSKQHKETDELYVFVYNDIYLST